MPYIINDTYSYNTVVIVCFCFGCILTLDTICIRTPNTYVDGRFINELKLRDKLLKIGIKNFDVLMNTLILSVIFSYTIIPICEYKSNDDVILMITMVMLTATIYIIYAMVLIDKLEKFRQNITDEIFKNLKESI